MVKDIDWSFRKFIIGCQYDFILEIDESSKYIETEPNAADDEGRSASQNQRQTLSVLVRHRTICDLYFYFIWLNCFEYVCVINGRCRERKSSHDGFYVSCCSCFPN